MFKGVYKLEILNDCFINDKRRAKIIPTHGIGAKIEKDASLFDEPSLRSQSIIGDVPSFLCGENFIYTKLGAQIGFTVKKTGWVFVLTETEPEEDNWSYLRFILTKAPGRGGFKPVVNFGESEILPNYGHSLTLYAGWFEEGYCFQGYIRVGQMAIIMADISDEYTPILYAQATENNRESSLEKLDILYKKEMQDDYYMPQNRGYQACPTIAITEKGSIYAAFMATPFGCSYTGGENHYGYVNIVRSRDGGITWEDPYAVLDPDKDGPCRTFEPILWTTPDKKRLFLFYTQAAGIENNWGGCFGTWITYCDNPESDNPTFSEPMRVFDGIVDSTPKLFSDGYWYVAVAFSTSLVADFFDMDAPGHERGVHIYRSKDSIEWNHFCYVPNTYGHISEPNILELNDGELLLIERTPIGTRYLLSNIKAPKTWTKPEKLCFDNNLKDLPMNPADTRNNIMRLPSGNLLYLFNNSRETKREFLSAALSKDGGKTFPYVLLLDERIHSSYPMADITKDGEILIIYDQGRSRASLDTGSEILFARITEEDIKQGEIVSPHSCLKRLVSRYGLAPNEASFECLFEKLPNKISEEYKNRKSLEDYLELCRILDNK